MDCVSNHFSLCSFSWPDDSSAHLQPLIQLSLLLFDCLFLFYSPILIVVYMCLTYISTVTFPLFQFQLQYATDWTDWLCLLMFHTSLSSWNNHKSNIDGKTSSLTSLLLASNNIKIKKSFGILIYHLPCFSYNSQLQSLVRMSVSFSANSMKIIFIILSFL